MNKIHTNLTLPCLIILAFIIGLQEDWILSEKPFVKEVRIKSYEKYECSQCKKSGYRKIIVLNPEKAFCDIECFSLYEELNQNHQIELE